MASWRRNCRGLQNFAPAASAVAADALYAGEEAMRRLFATAPALVAVPVVALGIAWSVAPAASAASAPPSSGAPTDSSTYVYWSYWTAPGSGTWTASTQGAGSVTPADGTSQGWRYGVGATSSLSQSPTALPDFTATCASTPAQNGSKRVAVYIDYGTAAVAPSGESVPANSASCAQVPTASNGLQVLSAVTSVRSTPTGEVCGLAGYPASGCSQQLSLSQVTSSESPNPATTANSATAVPTTGLPTWAPFVLGAIVIIGLVGAAIGINRRRRDQPPNG